jgi:hypothetical protein
VSSIVGRSTSKAEQEKCQLRRIGILRQIKEINTSPGSQNRPDQPQQVVFGQRWLIWSRMGVRRASPSPVLQDQWVQDVSAAHAPPAVEAEIPAVIEHIVELVADHQPTTPHAMHGDLLSDWPWPIVIVTDRHSKVDARLGTLLSC